MNEAEAKELAREINRYPGWSAQAEKEPFLDASNHNWWVKTHHDSMNKPGIPYGQLPVRSREEWDKSRDQWK